MRLNRCSRRSHSNTALACIATTLLLLVSSSTYAQHVYYRYLNKDGVKVLNHSIPPEYTQSGYEVLNASGQVVKVVPPAPSPDEVAKNAAEREAREIYARLSRRYSSVEEIESAKQRRLRNINTNISILNGNISGLQNAIQKIMSQAAEYERRGAAVPEPLLQKLGDTRAELKIADEILDIRKSEYQEVIDKYDIDIAAFGTGEALEKASKAEAQQ